MAALISSAKSFGQKTMDLCGAVGGKTIDKLEEARRVIRADKKGWLICALVLAITAVRSSVTYSFGIFIVPMMKEYKLTGSMGKANFIGTLSFCISLSCSPLSVIFIRFMGHKGFRYAGLMGTVILSVSCIGTSFVPNMDWLFLTHSLMYGIGSSLLYMSSSLIIGDYFNKEHKYHVLATSILLCGYPVGSFIFNPFNAWLIGFNWRTAFRVTSALVLIVGIPCCWNFTARESVTAQRLSSTEEESGGPDPVLGNGRDEVDDIFASEGEPVPGGVEGVSREKRWTGLLLEIRQRPEIAMWFMGNMFSYLGFYMPFVNLASYMQKQGIDATEGSVAVTLLSLAECVTYMVASFLGDYLKDNLVFVNIASSGALAVICLVWPLIGKAYWVILAISLSMGGFLGLNIVYTYAASGEVTGLPIDFAWSLTNFWSGIGILMGPLFTGFVVDIRDNYHDVFRVVGVVYLVDTACFAAIPLLQRWRGEAKDDVLGSGTKFETFKIKRSSSRTSVKENGEVSGSGGGTTAERGQVGGAYGTLSNFHEPYSPPAYSTVAQQLSFSES